MPGATAELQALCEFESMSGMSSFGGGSVGDALEGFAALPPDTDGSGGGGESVMTLGDTGAPCETARRLTYCPSTVLTAYQQLPSPCVIDEIVVALNAACCLASVRPALLLDFYSRKKRVGGDEVLLRAVREALEEMRVEVDA